MKNFDIKGPVKSGLKSGAPSPAKARHQPELTFDVNTGKIISEILPAMRPMSGKKPKAEALREAKGLKAGNNSYTYIPNSVQSGHYTGLIYDPLADGTKYLGA